MLTKFKKKVQILMAREARLAKRVGLTPNKVSTIGIFLALASGISYWMSGNPSVKSVEDFFILMGSFFLLASGFCDALDGVLARLYGEVTVFGGFLDSLLDRYADAAIYCGLILGGLCDIMWGLIALSGSLLVSYTRARAETEGVKMESVGLFERAERLLIISFSSFFNLLWPESIRWGVILLAVLTNITVAQRVSYFWKMTSKKNR
ncbi:TPA: CDP-alcohol phosphatidyltransferase family protein [Candidatus Bathyarchaeota archaeon]|nr:CDP-alcohol phosphatidyltransferase family protein [Candidatus Bathyarchaeota archaeon]